MARYKTKRKVGLGYVYYTLPEFTAEDAVKQASLTINPKGYNALAMQEIVKYEVGSPEYNQVITKRDDDFVKLLEYWNVPYTRDNSFDAGTVPLSQTVILDQNNNQVPIQTVLADPNSQVIITDEVINGSSQPQAKDNTMLYVGAGILAVGAIMYATSKKKKLTNKN